MKNNFQGAHFATYILTIILSVFICNCAAKKSDVAKVHVTLQKLDLNIYPNSSLTIIDNSTSEVLVHSFKVPIMGIALENQITGKRNDIYNCSGASGEECLVELASSTAMTDLLNASAAVVDEGEFDSIAIYHCIKENGYWSKVTAEVTDPLTSDSYYTHANWLINTTSPAEELKLQNKNCMFRIPLNTKIKTQTKQTSEISIFYDPRNFIHFGFSSSHRGWSDSGCSGDSNFDGVAEGAFVCSSPLEAIALSGSTVIASTERYLINNLSLLSLFIAEDGTVLGGSMRSYYNNQLTRGIEFISDVNLKSVAINSTDNTLYEVTSMGSYTDYNATSFFLTDNFKRSNIGDAEQTGTFIDTTGTSQVMTFKRFD